VDQNLNASQSSRSDRGAIEGRVVERHGQPVEEAVVLIVGDSPSHRDIAALTSGRGEYSFIYLLPGYYTLLVNVADFEPQEGSVEVLAGVTARLDFVFD
jgi:protocatechuate 3,4-dioxygenase beta subunit